MIRLIYLISRISQITYNSFGGAKQDKKAVDDSLVIISTWNKGAITLTCFE